MRRLLRAVFLILLLLELCLVWAFPRYATQDGPSHLYNAAVIAALRSGSWNGLSAFFRLNPRLVPNWTTYFILMQLMKGFSAANAEKILVSGYIVVFAISFWWVMKQIRPDSEHFLVFGLVLGGNWFLSMGFYNFCYGLVFFLIAFGYWLKWRRDFGIRQWAVLFTLAAILFLTHFFCFLMAAALIGVTGLFSCMGDARECKDRGTADRKFPELFVRSVIVPELCFLVFLLLNPLSAVGSQPGAYSMEAHRLANILHRLLAHHGTGIFYLLLDCQGIPAKIFVAVIGAFIVIVFYWTLRRSQEPISMISYGLAVFSVACFAIYVFAPSNYSGTGMLRERAGWFGLWGIFAFLASREWHPRGRILIIAIATILCVTSLFSGLSWRHKVYPLLNYYDDAARLIEPGKTILDRCYCYASNTSFALFRQMTVHPIALAGDIAALSGRDILVANYEDLGTSFPVEYLPVVNPALVATTLTEYDQPEIADLASYEKTGRSIDYVLVGGEPPASETGPGDSPLWRQLGARYRLIYSSPGSFPVRLFRRYDSLRSMSATSDPSTRALPKN